MTTTYAAEAVKVTKTKKGLRFKFYKTPYFFKKENAIEHMKWYIKNNPKYEATDIIIEQTIF